MTQFDFSPCTSRYTVKFLEDTIFDCFPILNQYLNIVYSSTEYQIPSLV